MNEQARTSILTPLLCFLLSMLSVAVFMAVPSFSSFWDQEYFRSHLYLLGTIGQTAMDLPAIFFLFNLRTKLCQDNLLATRLGDHTKGVFFGLVGALILAGVRLSISGHFMNHSFMGGVDAFVQSGKLEGPWDTMGSIAAILVYGPGEALFVTYLILAFDNALGNKRLISLGVLLASSLWSLPHLGNFFIYGLSALTNTVIMFFMGIAVSVVFKKSRSIFAPMVFWSLVNGTSF